MTKNKISVEIANNCDIWSDLEDKLQTDFDKICSKIINILQIDNKTEFIEISILLTNDEYIREINKEYRDKDKATNVLSFPIEKLTPYEYDNIEKNLMLGDIILSYETIKKEAKEQNKEFQDHLYHMLTHGMLHLLGFDHIEDDEAKIMEDLECKILAEFNISNPYH